MKKNEKTFDLVANLFGGTSSAISRVIYTLVGLAGLWCITLLFRTGEKATTHRGDE